jgi:GH24 family phage-related lysozyme (muramidase)
MASFRDLLKKQRQSGSGIISSVGSAALDSARESMDVRNRWFKSSSLLNALFPNVKGFKTDVKSDTLKIKPSNVVPLGGDGSLSAEKLDDINRNTKISAMNSVVLPKMAMDMNLMKLNIMKLVKIQGGAVSRKPDMFFAGAKERENIYEAQFGKKTTPTPVGETDTGGKKRDFMGSLMMGLLGGAFGLISMIFTKGFLIAGGLAALAGTLLQNEEVRNAIKSAFIWLMESIGKGFEEIGKFLLDDDVKDAVKSAAGKFFGMLGDILMMPIGEVKGIDIPLGGAVAGILGSIALLSSALSGLAVLIGKLFFKGAVAVGSAVTGAAAAGAAAAGAAAAGAAGRRAKKSPVSPGGKPLTDFGEVGKNREVVKNKALADKILDKLKKLGRSPKAIAALTKALAKRAGLASIVGLAGTLLSGGTLLPLILALISLYGAYELLQALDEALEEMAKEEKIERMPNETSAEAERLKRQTSPTPSQSTNIPETSPSPTQISSSGEVNEELVNFVKSKEGFKSKAYKDIKQYSIGYGTKANSPDEVITEEEADRRLRETLAKSQKTVIDFAKQKGYDWNQNQIDALTSFVYNLGPGALNQLTQNGKRTNEQIAENLLKYNKASNNRGRLVQVEGLTKRRKEELALFTSKEIDSIPTLASSTTRPPSSKIMNDFIALADSRMNFASAPVVINSPQTTNVSSPQVGGFGGPTPNVVDKEFMKMLVGRTI